MTFFICIFMIFLINTNNIDYELNNILSVLFKTKQKEIKLNVFNSFFYVCLFF